LVEEEEAVVVLEEDDDEEGGNPFMLSLDRLWRSINSKKWHLRATHVSLIARTAWGHSSE
jgi:hypothetical protein